MIRCIPDRCLWRMAILIDCGLTALVAIPVYSDQPATAPTTAPTMVAEQPVTQPSGPPLAGGRSIGPYDRPQARPAKPAFVSPMEGVSGGSGDKPADVQIGAGVGPSQGQVRPNASVTTGPVTTPPDGRSPAK